MSRRIGRGSMGSLSISATDLRDCEILLRIDNTTAVSYVNRYGSTHLPKLHIIAKQLWQWCEARHLWIFASYISSGKNTEADRESRINNVDIEWKLSEKAYQQIVKKLNHPDINLFASRINSNCKTYSSWQKNPDSYVVDAFTINWSSWKFYAFPPFSLILRTLQKIKIDRACGILVVPCRPTQPWYPLFQSMIKKDIIEFKPSNTLLCSPCRTLQYPLKNKLSLVAARLSWRAT